MMNLCSNSEERRDPKINEYLQVADRVREAGRCNHQETGKPVLKGDGNAPTFLTPSDGGTSTSRGLLARPKQDPESNSHEKSASSLRSAHIRDESSADQAQATLVTPKEQMKHPRGRGEARKNQPRSNGRTGVTPPQRLLTSEAPEEEQAQDRKRPARLKGAGGARRSQKRGDGRTSDSSPQRLLLSEVLDEEMEQVDNAPFSTVTLLTRGYFEVLFEQEEGAKAARKLVAVEWSGWALSFSRYSALFTPNEFGAEKLLTHSIKVQFPDLHVQLRTEKALTIMASSIGDVLDIESPDS
ncbi:unnamed protein product [Sphagnum jensenii]|uniref:Uncharacterized protein n=1 Tax=Sphagnum jensenii TaxID=128206 RepID=A0ABP1BM13_9BRYO